MTALPVGLSRDLPPKRVMRAEVAGVDVVVWRAPDGAIAAWNNRCPHRGMALSHGFVRGNSLACLYHGWHYGTSGQCTLIPAHPELQPPETIHVERYEVAETGGVIWVSVDGPVQPPSDTGAPLRSFIVTAPPQSVEAAAADRPPPHEASLALNPVTAGTQVTVRVPGTTTLGEKRALSRWCEALRRRAEASA